MVKVKARSSFSHGAESYVRGQEFDVSEPLADEMENAGLVTRAAPSPDNKMAAEPVANKTAKSAPITSQSIPAVSAREAVPAPSKR